jgi:hypothetical protein
MKDLMKTNNMPLSTFRPPSTGKTFIGDAWEQWRMKRVLEMVKLAKETQLHQHEAILEYTTFGQKLAAEQRAKQHEINKMEIEEHRLKAIAMQEAVKAKIAENEFQQCEVDLQLKIRNLKDMMNGTD